MINASGCDSSTTAFDTVRNGAEPLLATRILKFEYEDEYDPIAENGGVGDLNKSVYNYNELTSAELDKISSDIDASQTQLFTEDRSTDRLDAKGKKDYRESQRDGCDGTFRREIRR
jgi:hypothetical protein